MSVRKRKWVTSKGDERQAWVVDYVDQTGTRRLKTFARKKDADAWSSRTIVDVSKGEHVADSATVTVAEAGANWIRTCEVDGLEAATLAQYRQHLEHHIIPYIGRVRLSQLSLPAIRHFQDKLREADKPRSPAMVKRVTTSLGSILADAQERGLVARNAVREMTKRRRSKAKKERRQKPRLQVGVDIPTPEEISAILGAVKDRWRPFMVTAIFTGMRASELRGLPWSDVDLEEGKIEVRQRADRYNVIGPPKSEAGYRTIPLPPMALNTLKEWKPACPVGELNLVFPTGAGNIESHGNIVNRALHPPQVAAGVVDADGKPKYTGLHALRHFYASWCINPKDRGGLELPGKVVQSRLGHSTIGMTMDVYGHLFPSADDGEAMAEAERRLLSAVNAT